MRVVSATSTAYIRVAESLLRLLGLGGGSATPVPEKGVVETTPRGHKVVKSPPNRLLGGQNHPHCNTLVWVTEVLNWYLPINQILFMIRIETYVRKNKM